MAVLRKTGGLRFFSKEELTRVVGDNFCMSERTDIKSLEFDELESFVTEELGEKKFRAGQIFSWLHEKKARSFDEMTNLSKDLREKLAEKAALTTLSVEEVQTSKIDGTKKYLFALPDGNFIESVLMSYKAGTSVCVSTQVGCAMGCSFCASTIGGKVRSLAASEILDQIYAIERDTGERVSHCVLMGIGEPLDNYSNVLSFLHLITDERGQNMSERNITLSTSGLVPKIYDLAEEGLSITLALSLHAPTQEQREAIMPVAKTYEIHDCIAACKYYFEKTGRRVSFEYALIDGVNDRDEDAAALSALLHGFPCHVNLIPVNPVVETGYRRPPREACRAFQKKLEKTGINVTIRRELGRDIDGSCGQLRRKHTGKDILE